MQNVYNCPVDATISKIGGKYKAVILYHLGSDTLRYNQIRKKIPAITTVIVNITVAYINSIFFRIPILLTRTSGKIPFIPLLLYFLVYLII